MAQIIVYNDTGANIAAGTAIDLTKLGAEKEVSAISKCTIITWAGGATTSATLTPSTSTATLASHVSLQTGGTTIKLAAALTPASMIIMKVQYKGEFVRT